MKSPWIQNISLTLPTLQDNTADTDRLLNALKDRLNTVTLDIDLDLIKKLPTILRESNYTVCSIVFKDCHRWVLAAQPHSSLSYSALIFHFRSKLMRLNISTWP